MEAALHRVFLHLKDGKEGWNGSLTELASKLPAWHFCRRHNSFLINLAHVAELVRYEARLGNGVVIPVSKRRRQDGVEGNSRRLAGNWHGRTPRFLCDALPASHILG